MAYCSYCAGPLESGQTLCPRCGRGTPPPAPAQLITPGAPAIGNDARPSTVTIATALLVVAFLLSLLSIVGLLLTPNMIARLPAFYWFRTFGFWVLWIILIALFWMRQGWSRIAIVALLAWNIGNLVLSLARVPATALLLPILISILRVAAVFVMFTPDSNEWFKKPAP